jgi:hypothetical protein
MVYRRVYFSAALVCLFSSGTTFASERREDACVLSCGEQLATEDTLGNCTYPLGATEGCEDFVTKAYCDTKTNSTWTASDQKLCP